MKVCVKCKTKKPITDFRLHSKGEGITYRRPECRECEKDYNKKRSKIAKEYSRPEIGTTCDCCGRTDKELVLDHCHKDNKKRGWICQNCNLGLGRLGDCIEGVERALEYLKKYYNK